MEIVRGNRRGGNKNNEWGVEEVCNMVWNGAGWSEGWKMGILVSLRKKGGGKRGERIYEGNIVKYHV